MVFTAKASATAAIQPGRMHRDEVLHALLRRSASPISSFDALLLLSMCRHAKVVFVLRALLNDIVPSNPTSFDHMFRVFSLVLLCSMTAKADAPVVPMLLLATFSRVKTVLRVKTSHARRLPQ